MMAFGDISPIDYIFFKLAGSNRVEMMPLCELMLADGGGHELSYDPKSSNDDLVVLLDCRPNGKSFRFTKAMVTRYIETQVYGQMYKVVDFVIQPGGEQRTPAVHQFFEK